MRIPADKEIEEFEGTTRLWMKVDNINDDLYDDHFQSTIHTNVAILTTKQYIPPYLSEG